MDRVVDVLGDSLVWRLVLTADSQPHITFVSLNKPAVPIDHAGKVGEEQEGRKDKQKERGGGGSTLHDADKKKSEEGEAIIIERNVRAGRKGGCVCRIKGSDKGCLEGFPKRRRVWVGC